MLAKLCCAGRTRFAPWLAKTVACAAQHEHGTPTLRPHAACEDLPVKLQAMLQMMQHGVTPATVTAHTGLRAAAQSAHLHAP